MLSIPRIFSSKKVIKNESEISRNTVKLMPQQQPQLTVA